MIRHLLPFVVVASIAPAAGAVDPGDLLKYFPAPVNTVCVMNVQSILSSPRGEKGKWDKIDHTEYLAGAVPVNPSVERLVSMTEFSPSRPERGAAVAVVSTRQKVDLAAIAARHKAEVSAAGGEPAVFTPAGIAFLKLGDSLLGVMATEHRPDLARLVKYAKTATTSIQSPYLNAAVNNDGLRNHILIAVDVEDLVGPNEAKRAVALSGLEQQDPTAAAAVHAFIAGLKGVRIAANVAADGISVVVRLDSDVALKTSPDWVKAFVIASLSRNGAMLEDLPAAVAKSVEKYVTLSFHVSDPELAFMTALVLPPVPAGESIAVTPQGVTLAATQKYMKAVNQTIDDLQKKNKKAKEYHETALWHDAAATKIETTSPLGVDPVALQYGRGTAALLHDVSDSLRGIPLKADELAKKTYYYVEQGPSVRYVPFRGVGFDMWGRSTNTSTNLPEMQSKLVEAVKQDEENRSKIWARVDQERQSVQVRLNEKFKGGFGR